MGITRRQLLRWSGVSALGAVVFNGCRVPEEELLVESPVDLPEDLVTGIDNWYATLCRQDPGGCGVIVRVMEGRAKKVEGNPDYPINQGKHSARCEAGLQALYHPDRITEPLFQEGRTGEFRAISWEEARGKVAERLRGLQARRGLPGQSRFLLVTEPLRGHLALLSREFVQAYGGEYMAFEPLEQLTLRRAVKDVFGQDRLPDFDIESTRYLLSFGADFLSTWLSPVKYSRGYGEFRQGNVKRGVHVQVDPRFSMTAANADQWVPVKPGGEGILALSMAYVIIRDGQAARSSSLYDMLTLSEDYRPDNPQVMDATGVDAQRIVELAHAFADPRNFPSLAIGGGSAAAHTNGLFNLKAIYTLNILVGSVGVKGGILFNPPPPLEDLAREDVLNMGMPASFQEWRDLAGRPVEVLMVRGANPVHGLPAEANFVQVIGNASFVVTFSSFMDETAAMSDLILPEHTYLEEWGDDVPDPGPGYQVVGFQQPVVRPFHPGTRGFGDELLLLGRALNLGLESRLGLEGVEAPTFRDVLRKGAERLWRENRGSVQSTSFEGFWSGLLQRGGWWDASRREAPVAHPTPLEMPPLNQVIPLTGGPQGEDTFNLIPFLSNSMGDGRLAHLPWLQAAPDPVTTVVWHTWVEINSRTAEEKGIRRGDVLEVTSLDGHMVEAPAYPHPGVPPWTVSMPVGQGHTALGRYAEGVGANTISILAPLTDRDTRALAWAATRVRIRKTGKSIDLPKFEGSVPAIEPEEGRIIPLTPPA